MNSLRNELTALRTERSKTYTYGDAFLSRFYGRPLHWRRDDGVWQNIDLRFEQGRDAMHLGRHQFVADVATDMHRVALRPRDGKGEIVYTPLSWRIDGQERLCSPSPRVRRGVRGIRQTAGRADVVNYPTYTGLVNAVRLSDARDFEISEQVQLYGLYVTNELVDGHYIPDAHGRFNFADASGRIVFWINPAWIQRQGGDREYGVEHELSRDLVYTKRGIIPSGNRPVLIDTTTYYAHSGDGLIYRRDATWASARDTADGETITGTDASNNNSFFGILSLGDFWCGRGFFGFDTSVLGSNATVLDQDFGVYGVGNAAEVDLYEGTQADPTSLVVGDFDAWTGSVLDTVSTWSTSGYNTFNPGTAVINKTGYTKFVCRESDHDVDDVEPDGSGNGYAAGCYWSEETGTSKDPYLELTWSPGVSVSDALTLAEQIQMAGQAGDINLSDTLTLSEAVGATLASNLSVSDTLSLSESLAAESANNIGASDTLTLAESVDVEAGVRQINISRIDNWPMMMYSLADGSTRTAIDGIDIIALEGEVVAGVDTHKLRKAKLEAPTGTEDNPSIVSGALNWSGPQVIRIVPDGWLAYEMWGLVNYYTIKYGGSGPRADKVAVTIDAIESLLDDRIVCDGSGDPIASGERTADDYMKHVVTTCFTGNDQDGNSRAWNWGTLTVEGDTSEATALDSEYEEHGRTVLEVLEGLSEKYDVAYQLVPSVAADGSWTFTFKTKYPRGGQDKTAGDNRVIINDFAGQIPEGERWHDRRKLITAPYTESLADVAIDASLISTHGRIESKTGAYTDAQLELVLASNDSGDGSAWTLAHELMGRWTWMTAWNAGDLVKRNNNYLGITSSDEEISAVQFKFVDKRLQLKVVWGVDKPSFVKQVKDSTDGGYEGGGGGGGGAGGGGGSGSATEFGDVGDVTAVAAANAAGVSDKHTRIDHAHKGTIVIGSAGEILFNAGVLTIQTGTGISATKIDAYTAELTATSGAPTDAQYVVIAVDGDLSAERVLTAGNGLTLSDGGANGNATLAVGTPTTLSASTTNSSSGDTHEHEVSASNNPGAAVSLLETDAAGHITLQSLTTQGALIVNGNITVTGTVDGVDIAAFKSSYDSHDHNIGTQLKKYTTTLVDGHQHDVDVDGSDVVNSPTAGPN